MSHLSNLTLKSIVEVITRRDIVKMDQSVFLSYVKYAFRQWKGFREAVKEGMGGVYAKEKEAWMADEIEKYFQKYDGVCSEEIVDYLGSMLENEFDTYFEDGSLEQIAQSFCRAYPLSLSNPSDEMFREMEAMIPSVSATSSVTVQNGGHSSSESTEETICNGIEKISVSQNTEEDGWTKVGKRNKRRE